MPWRPKKLRNHSISVSKINVFEHFTQKFKMMSKNGGKAVLGKKWWMIAYILQDKNFIEFALSRSISEINAFLRFT